MLPRLAPLLILAALALCVAWPAASGAEAWRPRLRCSWSESLSLEVGYAQLGVSCFWEP